MRVDIQIQYPVISNDLAVSESTGMYHCYTMITMISEGSQSCTLALPGALILLYTKHHNHPLATHTIPTSSVGVGRGHATCMHTTTR